VALFLGGLFLGPTTIAAFELIDDLAIRGTQTEAQQWTQASVLIGVAFGASLAGAAVDLGGPGLAFFGGSVFVTIGALMITLRRRRLVPVAENVDHGAMAVAPPIHRGMPPAVDPVMDPTD
jgi:predicted MFS family arabinose efflux permease